LKQQQQQNNDRAEKQSEVAKLTLRLQGVRPDKNSCASKRNESDLLATCTIEYRSEHSLLNGGLKTRLAEI